MKKNLFCFSAVLALAVLSVMVLRFSTQAAGKPSSPRTISLRPGVYSLEGYNGMQDAKPYLGVVTIVQTGETYQLQWKVGRVQTQKGIGLLENGILSVGYYDLSGRDFGVVSYRLVQNGRLEGKWAPMGVRSYGTELLIWKSEQP